MWWHGARWRLLRTFLANLRFCRLPSLREKSLGWKWLTRWGMQYFKQQFLSESIGGCFGTGHFSAPKNGWEVLFNGKVGEAKEPPKMLYFAILNEELPNTESSKSQGRNIPLTFYRAWNVPFFLDALHFWQIVGKSEGNQGQNPIAGLFDRFFWCEFQKRNSTTLPTLQVEKRFFCCWKELDITCWLSREKMI